MTQALPPVVESLLSATDEREQGHLWALFLEEFSPLLLRVAGNLGGDEDAAMDRYTYIAEQLRAEGFRRLRGYASDGRGKFTTWLVVVARRLCHDHHRRRYGRRQSEKGAAIQRAAERRSLIDLIAAPLERVEVADASNGSPEQLLLKGELRAALEQALGALPAQDRLVLKLRFEDGASVPEIARALSEPSPFRMYRRIDKLLASLKQSLRAVGIEGPVP